MGAIRRSQADERGRVAGLADRRRALACRASSHRDPIESENDQSAHDGADEARRLAFAIPTDSLTEPGRQKGAANAEQHRDDEAGRVTARHQEARDQAGEEADDEGSDDAHGSWLL